MEDPLPENIEGSKRVTHTVEHRINWGYVAVAFVGLVLLVKVGPVLASGSSEESDDEPSL